MLAFRPERLGHAVTAAADAGLLPELLAASVPVELCLTSNVMSETVHSYGCVRPEIAAIPVSVSVSVLTVTTGTTILES